MKAQRLLRNGEPVEIEGLFFVIDGDGEVRPGDTYIAERNVGPQLLTCAKVQDYEWRMESLGITCNAPWIVPVEKAYCYDVGECVRVKMLED